ncbi:MAG: hypothetical protein ACRC2B_13435 [Rubrivivax sp.]
MLHALSVFVLAFWAGSRLHGDAWLVALASLALGLAAAALVTICLRQPPRQLIWDGVAWAVDAPQGDRQAGQVMLMLDLGNWVLVRFTSAEPALRWWRVPMWLPLSSRDAGASWPALRVALHALPPPDGATGAARRSRSIA